MTTAAPVATATTTAPTEPTVKEQAGKLVAQIAGYVGYRTVKIGLEHGIYEAIARHTDGIAPPELAAELKIDPFYTAVWCRSAFAAETLERADIADGDRYVLAPHMESLLLDPTSPAQLGAAFVIFEQPELFDRFTETLPSGERSWWDKTGPDFISAVSGTGRGFNVRLIPGGFNLVPGLAERLDAGADVLELACGAGIGLVRLAETYPRCRIVGVDGDAYSLELASAKLAAAGLEQRVQLVQSTLEDLALDTRFDLVSINISLHEARDVERVVENVRDHLRPDGHFVVSDFPFPSTPEGLRTPPGRFMSGIQFFEAQIDDQLLPTQFYIDLLERHGFRDVGSLDLTPTHALTYGRR